MGINGNTFNYALPKGANQTNSNDLDAKAQVEALKRKLLEEDKTQSNKIAIVDNYGKTVSVNDLKWSSVDADYRAQECFQEIPDIDLHNNPCATLNPNNIKLSKSEVEKHRSKITPEIKAFNQKMHVPSPEAVVEGVNITLKGIVDKSDHKTYLYDDKGKFVTLYRNAVGEKDTPTPEGLRYITKLEANPFKSKYVSKHPKEKPHLFGPFVFFTRNLARSGETSITGVFLHGTNHPESIGKDASISCVRHKNKDISEIAKKHLLEEGDIVKVQQ